MVPESSNVLGYCLLPPPVNGGSYAGDVILNANAPWQVGANYDVQSVALHEIGHALGLDHSSYTTAVMCGYYTGVKQALTCDDIGGIQSLWGAYAADTVNNGSFTTATPLALDQTGQAALGGQSLAGASDYDYYAVTVPASTTGTMTVTMQSAALSSVAPKLIAYNSAHTPLALAAGNIGGTATVVVTGVARGQTYFFRASAASAPGAFGAFGMLVNCGSLAQGPIAPPNTAVASQPDQGGGSANELASGQGTAQMTNNFNGAAIPYNALGSDNYIWFNSAVKASGVSSTATVTINVSNQFIDFTNPQNGAHYHLAVPNAKLVFTPATAVATTSFDAATGSWITDLPATKLAGNIFLSGLAFKVPLGGLPGGIKNVAWSGSFTTDTAGVALNWVWGAAVYNTFSADYNALGVKPVDDTHASIYLDADHAGTPEVFAVAGNVVNGATGGGGSNWTGGLSGTAAIAQVTIGTLVAYGDALTARGGPWHHGPRARHGHTNIKLRPIRTGPPAAHSVAVVNLHGGHDVTHGTGSTQVPRGIHGLARRHR
jgi:hypothetical protein